MTKLIIEQVYYDDVRETGPAIGNAWNIDFKIKIVKESGIKEIKVKIKDAYIRNYTDGIYILNSKQKNKIATAIKAKLSDTVELAFSLNESTVDQTIFTTTNKVIECMMLEDKDLGFFTSGKIGKVVPVIKEIIEELGMKGWHRVNVMYHPGVGKIILLEKNNVSNYGIPIIINGDKTFVSERALDFFKDELSPFVVNPEEN